MGEIRTFLAFPIPEHIKGYFTDMLAPIVVKQDKINWVKRENIHITLNYLGETDSEQIEEHATHLSAITNQYPPITLSTSDTGIYPHANEPRVLWVGAAPHDLTLNTFKQNLDKELTRLGYKLDKRIFQPHITLARVKSISRKSSFIHDFLSSEVREFNFEVDTLVWMKSTLTPAGAVYEKLKSFKFNSGGQ